MNAISAMADYLATGGLVMIPLVACAFVLWYAVGFRAYQLRRGEGQVSELLSGQRPLGDGLIHQAVALAQRAVGSPGGRLRLEEGRLELRERLARCQTLTRSIVVVAPLLGLLGTVTGMIELFDSLGSQTFNSQNGGIAKGIAEALFTTQLGLGIAIPGYFATRLLDRRAEGLESEVDQVVCLASGGSL